MRSELRHATFCSMHATAIVSPHASLAGLIDLSSWAAIVAAVDSFGGRLPR
jgi:hypothetical protein